MPRVAVASRRGSRPALCGTAGCSALRLARPGSRLPTPCRHRLTPRVAASYPALRQARPCHRPHTWCRCGGSRDAAAPALGAAAVARTATQRSCTRRQSSRARRGCGGAPAAAAPALGAATAARSELSPRARRCRSNSPGAGDPSAWFWLQRLVRRRRSSSLRVTPARGAISASLSTSRSRRCRRNSPLCVATPTLGTALAAPPATQPRARRPRVGPLRLGPRPALARSTPPPAQASRHTCPAVPCATAQLSAAQPTRPASRMAFRAATGAHLGSQSRARRGSQPASRHNYAQGSSRAPPPRSLVPAVTLASPRHGYPRDRSSGGRLAPQLLRGTATTSPALRLARAPRHHHPLGAAPLRYWPTPPCLTLLQQPAWRHNLTLDDATAARLAP